MLLKKGGYYLNIDDNQYGTDVLCDHNDIYLISLIKECWNPILYP